jgi:hypothetical protein
VTIQVESELSEDALTSFADEVVPLSPMLDLFLRGAPIATRIQSRGQR